MEKAVWKEQLLPTCSIFCTAYVVNWLQTNFLLQRPSEEVILIYNTRYAKRNTILQTFFTVALHFADSLFYAKNTLKPRHTKNPNWWLKPAPSFWCCALIFGSIVLFFFSYESFNVPLHSWVKQSQYFAATGMPELIKLAGTGVESGNLPTKILIKSKSFPWRCVQKIKACHRPIFSYTTRKNWF